MKKQKKKKKKKIIKWLILLVLLTLIGYIIYKSDIFGNYMIDYKLKKLDYSNYTIKLFKEEEITEAVLNENKYSHTLDVMINSDNFNNKYVDEYLKIEYVNSDKFPSNINRLLNIGYKSSEINLIFKNFDDNEISKIAKSDYNKNLTQYLEISYFKKENLERYLAYQNNESDITKIVTYVNIGLDQDYYTNTINVDNPNDLLVLCNKYHKLSSSYIPSDLANIATSMSTKRVTLRKEAKDAFEEMAQAALKEGITIYASSGYRSYSHQSSLYSNYVALDGIIEADRYSARPGYSEHQTGLAIDMSNSQKEFIDEFDKEYTWLLNNSYKYGYILRYPNGKENITGYMFEPWHYRYVGKNTALEIKTNLTFDEYLARK